MGRSHGFAVALALFVGSVAGAQTISNGSYSVTLDRMGLIERPPVGGLTSTYGPRVTFEQDAVEWFGVQYDEPSGRTIRVVGEGRQQDWARRTPVQYVRSGFTPDGASTVSRAGDLEIEHTFAFDEPTGCLVIGVILRNNGPTAMNMVFYTREWHAPGMAGGTFPSDWEPEIQGAPDKVWRMCWMPNNIGPGGTQGCVIALEPAKDGGLGPAADDVPLQLWKGGSWTSNGVNFGTCWGISFCDFNHDGFIDVYSNASRDLWENLGGTDWVIAANLNSKYPPNFEYGSGWADYNDDQLPDFGSEPRGQCMALLKNLGGANFDNVGDDSSIVDVQPCNAPAETLSIADVDGDGYLDWFLPTYPSWIGGSGNWFLYNLGPDSMGEYTFREESGPAGLDNPPFPVNRPEGAEFCDYDYDGDVDLYSNNTIYRNLSTPGTALFEAMTENGSGVVFSNILDEGAGFLDYDMDGDMDLCIAFCDSIKGVRMFENNGDGTFTVQPKSVFDSASTGLCLGLSHEDWDNDGDVDVTTSEVFRRNQFQETGGTRHFTVATHSIPAGHITDAVPAWGDFDKDGDLDSALGNWSERGRLYENYTYDSTTADDLRRYARVKVVRDSDVFDDGLESEYGAQVTVRPIGVSDINKRVRIVSTSGGYLNQNEYGLHFALPADPDPANPDVDLSFSVSVDLKGSSDQGFPRVDRHVNPILAAVELATLDQREILVYRSGRVILDGEDFRPALPVNPLITTTGGLLLPAIDTAPPLLTPSPGLDWFVGIEISTANATEPLRIEELILDGHIDSAVSCSGVNADTFVWDVTNPSAPVLAEGGQRDLATRPRNERNYLAIDATLEPARVYRIVCRVIDYRPTPITAPVDNDVVTTNGGLFFQDSTPCTGAGAAAATIDPANVYLAVRFRPQPSGSWAHLGNALAGTSGEPALAASGTLREGEMATLALTNAAPNAPAFLVLGFAGVYAPLFGGVLVPSLDVVIPGFMTDGAGALTISATWPGGVPGGTTFYGQILIADPATPRGFAFSNGFAGSSSF